MTFSPAPNPHNELNHVEAGASGERGHWHKHGTLRRVSHPQLFHSDHPWERSIICARWWNKSLKPKNPTLVTAKQPPSPLVPIKRNYKNQMSHRFKKEKKTKKHLKLNVISVTTERKKSSEAERGSAATYASFPLSINYLMAAYILCISNMTRLNTEQVRITLSIRKVRYLQGQSLHELILQCDTQTTVKTVKGRSYAQLYLYHTIKILISQYDITAVFKPMQYNTATSTIAAKQSFNIFY